MKKVSAVLVFAVILMIILMQFACASTVASRSNAARAVTLTHYGFTRLQADSAIRTITTNPVARSSRAVVLATKTNAYSLDVETDADVQTAISFRSDLGVFPKTR